jgi:hypothetical protein
MDNIFKLIHEQPAPSVVHGGRCCFQPLRWAQAIDLPCTLYLPGGEFFEGGRVIACRHKPTTIRLDGLHRHPQICRLSSTSCVVRTHRSLSIDMILARYEMAPITSKDKTRDP